MKQNIYSKVSFLQFNEVKKVKKIQKKGSTGDVPAGLKRTRSLGVLTAVLVI